MARPSASHPLIHCRSWGLGHSHAKLANFNFSSLLTFALTAFLILATTRFFTQDHSNRVATVGVPLKCHSHNDYWRRRPLYDALEAGCIGVEADIWRRNNDLYVAHNAPNTARTPTLSSLYVQPLVHLLERRNLLRTTSPPHGVFPRFPNQTLVFMIDFKEPDREAFAMLHAQLQPLRERGWLTFYANNSVTYRPVTVVLTGDAILDWVLSNTTYRDVFLDAPALALHADTDRQYNWTNSFYSSAKFGHALGMFSGYFGAPHGVDEYVEMAHERGLHMRFWSQPAWPVAMRNRLWGDLVDAGVDFLNVDDLAGVNRWLAERNDIGRGSVVAEEIPVFLD
ncbi:hypothetical protein TD95_002171 [Thielaviopsis punctulata]|uniref:Altered inheritance of mitochondria protein 6 n=1 Tax=Thielaviopsis punctulata TaxID=72032 RepID=A0A0F4Z792_9PEZI|nr:hypothetical protein TD95_002171 [Thielaviopsis punctulata]